jgi:FkbM family methyltransferase
MINKKAFVNGYFAIKKCKHGYFAYNLNDNFIGKSLELYGEWTEAEIEGLSSLLAPGDVILDIGAYIGTHTIPFAKNVSPGGKVYAFESQRTAYAFLNTNIALNNLMNVVTVNKFVTDSSLRKVVIPVLDQRVAQNYGSLTLGALKNGEWVETISIDSLKLPKVRLIKIDTEGTEIKVLRGARQTIKRCRPILYVEATDIKASKKIITEILSFGYKSFWHLSDYYNPNNTFKNKKNVFKSYHPEVNLLCFPKEIVTTKIDLPEVSGPNDNWEKVYERLSGQKLIKM